MELIINRGLPGSGKSTQSFYDVQADFAGTVRVNRDDIRKMFHQGLFLGKTTENNVERARDDLIRGAMKRKTPKIISDDTNLNPAVVKHLAKIAEFFGYDVLVRDFNTDLKTCIERDAQRDGSAKVGEDVIRGMHKKWFKGGQFPENPLGKIEVVTFEPYVPNTKLPKAVVFDIDGTLASHEVVRSPYDYTKVSLDAPRQAVVNALSNYYYRGYFIIILSGREDSCREDTIQWILKNTTLGGQIDGFGLHWNLFMRAAADKRQDRVIKGELFDKHIRNNFNVEVVFDDRDQVVALWREELSIDCFQVNYGNF
jgi:predicted kinase